MADPICGNCGKPLSKHFKEDQTYFCYEHTNGDAFDNEPSERWLDQKVIEYALSQRPDIYDELILSWQKENGHL